MDAFKTLTLPRRSKKQSINYKTLSPLDSKKRAELKKKDNELFATFHKKIGEIKNEPKIRFDEESSEIRASALKEQLNLIPPEKITSVIKIIRAIQKDICNANNFRKFPLQIGYLSIPGLDADEFFKNIFYFARHKHFFRYIGRQFFEIKNTSSINKIITILQDKLEEKETFIPNEEEKKQNAIEVVFPKNILRKENSTLCLEIDPVNFQGTFPSQRETLYPHSPLDCPINFVEAV